MFGSVCIARSVLRIEKLSRSSILSTNELYVMVDLCYMLYKSAVDQRATLFKYVLWSVFRNFCAIAVLAEVMKSQQY